MMDDFGRPSRIDVSFAGYVARRVLRGEVRARVEAVFENSFYLNARENWLCLAGPSVAMGPVVLRCEVPEETDWRATGILVGMTAQLGDTSIHLQPFFVFSFADTYDWTPPAIPEWTPQSLSRGVSLVGIWMRGCVNCGEGLGELIHPNSGAGPKSVVAQRASGSVRSLCDWLAVVLASSNKLPMVLSDTIDRLIGLGHGLPPSGDDFLGGAMIGLQLVGRSDLSKLLFENVEGKVALRSNAISAAHLAAAAEGAGGEWLHGALNGILTGDVELLPTALTNVGRMGHTSGLDALAGAITVFREWLACEPVGHCQLSWQLSPSSAHSSFIRSSPSRV